MNEPGVSVETTAPPGVLYDLVTDITRMADWSPEVVRCRWIGRRREPVAGARFRGWSRKGVRRWSTVSTVIEAERPRQFAFRVRFFGRPVATWRYRITPAGTGAVLHEAVDDERGPLLRRLSPLITGSSDRQARNDETMHVTLERIRAAAEAEPAA